MIKKTLYLIIFCTPLLLFHGALSAQSVPFLDVNPDAHVMGMANTGTVMYANAFSIWSNSSSTLFSDQKMDIAASYGMWQPSVSGNNVISVAGYGRVAKFMSITAGVKYYTHKPYDISDANGNITGTFSPKEMSAGIGLAFKILPILSASANVHYVMSDMGGPKKANAVSADFGAMVHLKFMNIGVTASNIGSKINYGGASSYSLPANLKIGVGTSQTFSDIHKITANLQGGMTFHNTAFFGELGAEYMYNELVAARVGFHYGNPDKTIPPYVSVGLGAKFFGISLNAAYLIAVTASSPLKNTFSVSVGWGF